MFQYIVIIVTCRFPFFSTLSFMLKATEMIFMTTCSSRPETRFKKCMNPTYLVMAVKDSCLKRESLCRLPIRHFALFVVGLAKFVKATSGDFGHPGCDVQPNFKKKKLKGDIGHVAPASPWSHAV